MRVLLYQPRSIRPCYRPCGFPRGTVAGIGCDGINDVMIRSSMGRLSNLSKLDPRRPWRRVLRPYSVSTTSSLLPGVRECSQRPFRTFLSQQRFLSSYRLSIVLSFREDLSRLMQIVPTLIWQARFLFLCDSLRFIQHHVAVATLRFSQRTLHKLAVFKA